MLPSIAAVWIQIHLLVFFLEQCGTGEHKASRGHQQASINNNSINSTHKRSALRSVSHTCTMRFSQLLSDSQLQPTSAIASLL
jgi:hypothetical protein